MKKLFVLFLVLIIAAAAGCGKKEAEPEQTFQKTGKRVGGGSFIDPIDKQPVDVTVSNYSYVYKDFEYNFNSKENMETFIKNPEKYVITPEISPVPVR